MSVPRDQSNYLDPEQRAATIRETFEAITAVGFMKWKAEELALGNELTEEDRKLYFREFEKDYFADFQRMTANASDDRLLDAMEFWIEKANTMGLKEWQEVLSAGQGAKPWYEALEKEVAAEMARSACVSGDQIGWDDESEQHVATVRERTSVLGYALSGPAPEPSPQQERTKDRTSGR